MIERLEDLSILQQRAMLKASTQATVYCGAYGEANRLSCLVLVRHGLMNDYTMNRFELTERGAALVREYQARHEAASEPEWKKSGFATEDEWLFMQSVGHRDQDVVKLEAQVAALQAENARLRAALKPFAVLASFDGWNTSATSGKDAVVYSNDNGKLTRGDFDAAYLVLQPASKESQS